jgi:two-component system OmpR family response regulator
MKILVVEDEPAIAEGLRFNFEQEGYDVVVATDGFKALEEIDNHTENDTAFDIILLDLMLPGKSGYETCREIRERDNDIAILVLSARQLSEDRTLAFDSGCDQYMSKPFSLPELLSRVQNLTSRRSRPAESGDAEADSPSTFTFGDGLEVRFDRFEIDVRGSIQSLTTMECQLLKYFIDNADLVLSREQIMATVWGEDYALSYRTIDNFVMRLRKVIEPDPSQPRHIVSVRGTGYRFLPE